MRPHVPFVAPKKYYEPFLPYSKMKLPPKIEGDWNDIPKPGINYCTSLNMKMDIRKQKKAVGGYYASVAFVDAQVAKVKALTRACVGAKRVLHLTLRRRITIPRTCWKYELKKSIEIKGI